MASKHWKTAHWVYLALLGCLLPICVLLNIFPCSPIATYFSLQAIARVPDGQTIRCLDRDAINFTTTTRYVHIVTDWLLLPVPLIIIYKLQMPVGKKVRLMLVFCLGFISSVASIIRNVLESQRTSTFDASCEFLQTNARKRKFMLLTINCADDSDTLTLYAWDIVDIFFATIVASLPPLNGLAEKGIDRIKSSKLFSGDSLRSKIRLLVSSEPSSHPGNGYSAKIPDGISSHELTGYRKDTDISLSLQLDAEHKFCQPGDGEV